jgi:hypothetical protein
MTYSITNSTKNRFLKLSRQTIFVCGMSLFILSFIVGRTNAAFTASAIIYENKLTTGVWGDEPEPQPLPIEDYAVFGASDVSVEHDTETGTNVTITDGLIGSNRSIHIGGGTNALGIRAGADVDTGTNVVVGTEGVIANDDITLGGGTATNGELQGESLTTGTNVDTYADVIVDDEVTFGGGSEAHTNVDALDATLGTNAKILGTLTLPLGETPTLGGGASVAILVNDGTPLSTPETFTPITLPEANVFVANNDDYTVSGGGTLTLAPGVYGELETGTNVTLNFSSGTYVFESFDIGGGTDINLDLSGGDILFFIVGDLDTGTNIDTNLTGGTAEDVYWEAGGIISLGGGTLWQGTTYSTKHNKPDENGVTTGTNVDVFGALYSAEQVQIGGGSNITLVGPFFGTYDGSGPVLVADVVLNEIYPRPYNAGVEPVAPYDREWVEIYNNSGAVADVLGWTVKVAATSHIIEATCSGDPNRMQPYSGDTTVASGELLVLEFCNNGANNKMSNSGATVELLDDSLVSFDSHTYPSTAEGKSHQRIPDGGIWIDPDPTPGEPNRVSRQDLIDAGFTDEMIEEIIAILAARGETLVGEETEAVTEESTTTTPDSGVGDMIEDSASEPINRTEEDVEDNASESEDDEVTGNGLTEETEGELSEEATATFEEVEETGPPEEQEDEIEEANIEPVLEETKVEEDEPQTEPEEITNEATI